jgi:AbrB family looped-hinge helix DNA binding protein
MAFTSRVTSRGQITIPQEIRETLHLGEGSVVQFELEGSRVSVVPLALVPADQTWFWTKEHQAKEKEADQDLTEGNYKDFSSADSLIKDLKRGSQTKKA